MRVQLAPSLSVFLSLSLSLMQALGSVYLFVRLLQNIVEYYFLFILPLTLIFISVSASLRTFRHSLCSLSFAAVAAAAAGPATLLITSLVAYVIQVLPTGVAVVVGRGVAAGLLLLRFLSRYVYYICMCLHSWIPFTLSIAAAVALLAQR